MKTSLLSALFAMLILSGCVAPLQHGDSINQEIGRAGLSDTLVSECRMPCNVSPGKDCC